MIREESEITFSILNDSNLYPLAIFIMAYVVVETLILVKPFVMLKNVVRT